MKNPVITINILTYKRPHSLKRLLRCLQSLNFPDDNQIVIVVVDNNNNDSYVDHLIRKYQHNIPRPVIHIRERRRGISFARNRAIEYANSVNADFFIFLDDDEIPQKDWLCYLIARQRETDADIVSGPVVAIFRKRTPLWINNSTWYINNNKKQLTKQIADQADSANVMISFRLINKYNIRFDTTFNFSGGEDIHFYHTVKKCRARFSWAPQALVYAPLSIKRSTLSWHLLRAYRTGASGIMAIRKVGNNTIFARMLVKSVPHIIYGSVMLFLGLIQRRYLITGVWHIAYGVGVWNGLFGITYQEYLDAGD